MTKLQQPPREGVDVPAARSDRFAVDWSLPHGRGDRPLRLVLVDDNDGIRELLRALVEKRAGDRFEIVGEAADGREAIEVVGSTQPDVVILDAEMPVLDGVRAIPGLLASCPPVRIVMFSALGHRREQALAVGAHAWAPKGCDWPTLERLITSVVTGGG